MDVSERYRLMRLHKLRMSVLLGSTVIVSERTYQPTAVCLSERAETRGCTFTQLRELELGGLPLPMDQREGGR